MKTSFFVDDIEYILFKKVYLSAYLPLALVISIIAYFYTMPHPDMEYVIGDHELLMIWYFSALSFFCLGLIQGVYYTLKLTIIFFGKIFGRVLSPFSSKRLRNAICLVCFMSLLFIWPTCIILSILLIFSILMTTRAYYSSKVII